MTFTILLLAQHQEVQDKVGALPCPFPPSPGCPVACADVTPQAVAEVLRVLQQDRLATMEDMPQFKFLEACMRESLRLYVGAPPPRLAALSWRLQPPVHAVARMALGQDRICGKYLVNAGDTVLVNTYTLGRQLPEGLKFDPDRWLSPEAKHFPVYSFGGGARACSHAPRHDPDEGTDAVGSGRVGVVIVERAPRPPFPIC